MAKESWKYLRVRASTHARLLDLVESLQRALEQAKIDVPYRHNVAITMDDAVRILLDRDAAKKERARKAKKRARTGETPPE